MPLVITLLTLLMVALVVLSAASRLPVVEKLLKMLTGRRDADRFCASAQYSVNNDGVTPVAFITVKMRGRIIVPSEMYDTDVQVTINDSTEGLKRAKPVLSTNEEWQMEDSPAFSLVAHNGKIPSKISVLGNWVQVAQIPCNVLIFPRKGKRKLKVKVAILSKSTGHQLLSANARVDYLCNEPGYIDKREKIEIAETLSLQLAAAVCASTGSLHKDGIDLVDRWILDRIESAPNKAIQKHTESVLTDAWENALSTLTKGKLDTVDICRNIMVKSSIMDRYNLIRFCLQIVAAKGTIEKRETDTLIKIADLLDIDAEKFRSMAQKVLPVTTHNVEDLQFILGIDAQMDDEQIRDRLNIEYLKWNGRVTHPEQEIREQAGRMLAVIAEARNVYIEQTTSTI